MGTHTKDALLDLEIQTGPTVWLFWDRNNGWARIDGYHAPLYHPPLLTPNKLVRELSFAPELHDSWVRYSGERAREMTTQERESALAILNRMRGAAATAVTEPGGLRPLPNNKG